MSFGLRNSLRNNRRESGLREFGIFRKTLIVHIRSPEQLSVQLGYCVGALPDQEVTHSPRSDCFFGHLGSLTGGFGGGEG